MPAMTMMFVVSGAEMLNGLKPGDKVRFSAEVVNGSLTVTSIRRE
jgi:Cu(I)/Ag(I) efflux system protein CusF